MRMRLWAMLALAVVLAWPAVAAAEDIAVQIDRSAPPAVGGEVRTFERDHARRLETQRMRDALVAQVVLPVNISTLAGGNPALAMYQDMYGNWYCDGMLQNTNTSSVWDVLVSVVYHDAGDVEIGADEQWMDYWILPNLWGSTFQVWMEPPAGWDHTHIGAEGYDTTEVPATVGVSYISQGTASDGRRYYTVRVTNGNAFTVVGAVPYGYETFVPTAGVQQYWTTREPWDLYQSRLAPGETVDVQMWSVRPRPTDPGDLFAWYGSTGQALQAPPTSPVYRFYNRRTGTHFYTIDAAEAADIQARLGWLYQLDGVAYGAYGDYEIDSTPLYRFYNRRNGAHFFTADLDEANNVIATMSAIYQYEGPGFYIADSGGLATSVAYRFYNTRAGVHFYTIDPTERDSIVTNLGHIYRLEGEAFHVPRP